MNEHAHEPAGEDRSTLSPEAATTEPEATVEAPAGTSAATSPRMPAPPWRRFLRRLTDRPRSHLAAWIAVAVVVTVTAGTLGWSRPAPLSTAPGASAPDRSARPATSSGGLLAEPLAAVDVHPIAALAADHAVGSVVQLDSRFRLTSVDGTPASTLASRLTVTPRLAFSATPESGDQAVTLVPDGPLDPGVVYRFALAGSAGELVDTWAFQARQALHIVSTIPDHQQSDVPLDTGIEVTFDQDGVGDVWSHISIDPPTDGRFETHDRTIAFVPDKPLAPRTIYTVKVTKGVKASDTGEQTQEDTRFSFETASPGKPAPDGGVLFPEEVVESAMAERPVIGVWQFGDDAHPVKTAAMTVFRFPTISAAVDAWRSLRARPDWTRFSTRGLVETAALRRVLVANVKINGVNGTWWISLPERLAAGWYLVQLDAARPIQTVLQVTDIAGYIAVSETRTVVWANDVGNGHAVPGATAMADGVTLGRTNSSGLLLAATPAALMPQTGSLCDRPCDPVVTVTAPGGSAVFVPTQSSHDKLEGIDGGYMWSAADQRFWAVLNTDRSRYRSTDTINLWGMVRSRADGSVPGAVTVRFRTTFGENAADHAIAAIAAKPTKNGVFLASIPLVDMPEGTYGIDLVAGDRTVRSLDVEVGPIAKPAYQLQIATGRRVYVADDRIKVTVRASFFDGTPVPGVPLRIQDGVRHSATTAPDGTSAVRVTAIPEPGIEGPTGRSVEVSPTRTEEAAIAAASQGYLIYPSTSLVDGQASIVGGRIAVNGSVHELARDRMEQGMASGAEYWTLDPRGPAIGRAAVSVRFVELIPHRVDEGSTYDFIAKKVVPSYRVEVVRRDRGTVRVRTTAAGSFRAAFPNPVAGHDYEIVLSVADADGHVARSTVSATSSTAIQRTTESVSLRLTTPQRNDANEFGVGDRVDVTMSGGTGSGRGSRYLFFVAHQGIRSAVVQPSARFATPFTASALPNLEITVVRFDGKGYAGDVSYAAHFRTDDRQLDVRLSADADRYRPGETATVRVRTLDARGAPVPATVVLRGVDEKLFAIGAAGSDDPMAALYEFVEPGVLGTYASHHRPRSQSEGGDTTGGGGDRSNFEDAVLFRAITTDASGRGSASFKLSDDLTAWRVSASAFSDGLQAGTTSLLLPVGLPFFVDASIAPEYLVGDRPAISVRTYGSAVTPGTPVVVSLSSPTLGASTSVSTTAFASIDLPLPELRAGVQTVTITATTGTGASARADRLTRTFRVVESRLTRAVTSLSLLTANGPATLPAGTVLGGTGLTTVVISDAGAGAYLSLLEELSSGGGARLEQALAADLADTLLVERFGLDATGLDPSGYTSDRYQSNATGGMAILPYAGTDLEASAFAAIVAPSRVDRQALTAYLRTVHVDPETTRERRLLAAAGLAALGDPVLPELQRAGADETLTVRERLYVGIGAAAAGDSATARSVAGRLVSTAGEQLGDVARLRVGDDVADTRQATALMAVLAAMTGDERAPLFWAYVAGTPVGDRLESLPAIAYVTASLQRLVTVPASFAISVDGHRTTIVLKPGESHRLSLTSKQVSTLQVDRISGSIAVLGSWRQATSPTAFQRDPDVSIARAIAPGAISGSSLVRVDLTVRFGPSAAPGCHDVTDLLPSGLTPVGLTAGWRESPEEEQPASDLVSPYQQSASFVRFCADAKPSAEAHLRYYARAITTGTYVWEPTVIESSTEIGHASVTEASTLTIR